MKTIYLAGGCFWGVQKFFDQFDGVLATETGYANGPTRNPTYQQVSEGIGHVETVRIDYDEFRISLRHLLEYYFLAIDPYAGMEKVRPQYRTGIYWKDSGQLETIKAVCRSVSAWAKDPVTVEIAPISNFYPADPEHQKYFDKHPDQECHIPPIFFQLAAINANLTAPAPEPDPEETALRQRIGDMAYHVTQNAGTELPYTGEYDQFFEKGLYVDIVSGEPLFTSADKYNSGCGWPAFTKPIAEDTLTEKTDHTHGMVRTEVRSAKADSHLGHVFNDGPRDKGGLRYCINSAALRFIPYDKLDEEGYGEYKKQITD